MGQDDAIEGNEERGSTEANSQLEMFSHNVELSDVSRCLWVRRQAPGHDDYSTESRAN